MKQATATQSLTAGLAQCEAHIVFGDRPLLAPDDWIVFNAPRPMMGQKSWEGPFLNGRHYAAVDPDDELAAWCCQRNKDLQGVALCFFKPEHAKAMLTRIYRRQGVDDREIAEIMADQDTTLAMVTENVQRYTNGWTVDQVRTFWESLK